MTNNLFLNLSIDHMEQEKRKECYKTDIRLWAKDKLGIHLWKKQVEIAEALIAHKKVAVKSCHGSGKGLTLDTPIPTPSGWTSMGEIGVGDFVLDEQGSPTMVTAVSPEWERDCYRVTFDDGTYLDTNDVHEWQVTDLMRRNRSPKVDWREHWGATHNEETQTLASSLRTNSGQLRYRIPLTKPLSLPKADLPIDPYLLGFWLGDGTSSTGNITIGETKLGLLDYLDTIGQSYEITDYSEEKSSYLVRMTKFGFKQALDSLGVLNNKHIPQSYLRSSTSQREALLAGMMDSDGFMMKSASVGLDTTSKVWAHGIMELVRSLGGKAIMHEGVAGYTKNGVRTMTGTRYRLNWRPLANPFRIRCQEWKDCQNQRSRHTLRTITSIEKIETQPTVCISVGNASHLYLAGEGMVPTHNSYFASVVVAWWVDTRYGKEAVVVSTAPSAEQVSKVLWRYIRQHHEKNNLLGYVTMQNEWKDDNGAELAWGRKPADTSISTFQGIHASGGVLAVLDEANGVADQLWTNVYAITTGKNDHILAIANPDVATGEFARIFLKEDPDWHLITISAYDTPNFTGEWMPEEAKGGLVSPQWVEARKRAWGVDDPRFKAKVLGEFSTDSTNKLFSLGDINTGTANEIIPAEDAPVWLGCDISRFGEDSTVVYSNHGGVVRLEDAWNKTDTVTTSEKIHDIAIRCGATQVRIDGVGLGAPVVDFVARLADFQYEVIGLVGNASPPDLDQWANMRAYWYDKAREYMRNGHIDISIEDEQLQDELLDMEYKFTSNRGAVQIESKDDIRKRLGRSPDYGDAFMYAVADLTVDPTDPITKLKPGEEFELDIETLLWDVQTTIGPI